MQHFFYENRVFFSCFILFLLVGAGLLLTIETGDCIRFFSNHRSFWGDLFFRYGTQIGEEPTYFVAAFILLFVRFRYILLIALSGLIVTIVAFSAKAFFLHDRPSVFFSKLKELETLNLIEGVDLLGSATSFPSGHTMSGFALFALLAFLSKYKKWVGFTFFMFALIVGVSRIYLVQHFLKDVYLGAIMGVIIAILIYQISLKFPYNETRRIDRKFNPPRRRKAQA